MPKALCIAGMVVAILVILLFLVDLAIGQPFSRARPMLDVVFLICASILAYMSWSTLKEQS